jgi:hypothetical protein
MRPNRGEDSPEVVTPIAVVAVVPRVRIGLTRFPESVGWKALFCDVHHIATASDALA